MKKLLSITALLLLCGGIIYAQNTNTSGTQGTNRGDMSHNNKGSQGNESMQGSGTMPGNQSTTGSTRVRKTTKKEYDENRYQCQYRHRYQH